MTAGSVIAYTLRTLRRDALPLIVVWLVGGLGVTAIDAALRHFELADGGVGAVARVGAVMWMTPATIAVIRRAEGTRLGAIGWGVLSQVAYVAVVLAALVALVIPGLLVIARRFPMVAVATAEGVSPAKAWREADTITQGRHGLVLVVGLAGLAIRAVLNLTWPGTAELNEQLGGTGESWS